MVHISGVSALHQRYTFYEQTFVISNFASNNLLIYCVSVVRVFFTGVTQGDASSIYYILAMVGLLVSALDPAARIPLVVANGLMAGHSASIPVTNPVEGSTNQFMGGAGIGGSIAGGLQVTRLINGGGMNPEVNITFLLESLLQAIGMVVRGGIQRRRQTRGAMQAFSPYQR